MLYLVLLVVAPSYGNLLVRATVDGEPSDLVTVTIGGEDYPQQVEILTTPADWVIKEYDDGSHDSTLPVSIVAHHVYDFSCYLT